VERALAILSAEIDRAQALLGFPRLTDLDTSAVRAC
jgi:isopentenyl diphosphate isomerase/L-lactate dehydrogenase-like FMN-dependent dehydrogenase